MLESMKTLSENSELKENLLKEFDKQVNWNLESDEKWNNYRTFIENDDTLNLFFEKYDFKFIFNQILLFVISSKLDKDKLSENIFKELLVLIEKKSLKWFSSEEEIILKDIGNKFWYLLRGNFYASHYSWNSNLYNWLKDNKIILEILFIVILYFIKNKDYYNIGNIKNDFDYLFWGNTNNVENKRIYQYLAFREWWEEEFNKHLLIISFLVVFLEDKNELIYNFRNKLSQVSNYNIFQVFKHIKDLDNIYYKKYLLIIKNNWLLHNFLRKIEKKNWINKEYKIKLLFVLLENNFFENGNLIDFSELFLKYDEVKEKFIEISNQIEFNWEKILKNLTETNNWLIKDTIRFLLIKSNKKYIKKDILNILIQLVKEKLIESITLEKDTYWKLFENILNWEYWKINLNLALEEFDYVFVEKIVDDIDWEEFTLKNIEKVIIKKDLKQFYLELVKKYIETEYSIWNQFSITDIRKYFRYTPENKEIEKHISNSLEKLTVLKKIFRKEDFEKTDDKIIRLVWNKNYKVL